MPTSIKTLTTEPTIEEVEKILKETNNLFQRVSHKIKMPLTEKTKRKLQQDTLTISKLKGEIEQQLGNFQELEQQLNKFPKAKLHEIIAQSKMKLMNLKIFLEIYKELISSYKLLGQLESTKDQIWQYQKDIDSRLNGVRDLIPKFDLAETHPFSLELQNLEIALLQWNTTIAQQLNKHSSLNSLPDNVELSQNLREEGENMQRQEEAQYIPIPANPVQAEAPAQDQNAAPAPQPPVAEAVPVEEEVPVAEAVPPAQPPVVEAVPPAQPPVVEAVPPAQPPVAEAVPPAQPPVAEAAPAPQPPTEEEKARGAALQELNNKLNEMLDGTQNQNLIDCIQESLTNLAIFYNAQDNLLQQNVDATATQTAVNQLIKNLYPIQFANNTRFCDTEKVQHALNAIHDHFHVNLRQLLREKDEVKYNKNHDINIDRYKKLIHFIEIAVENETNPDRIKILRKKCLEMQDYLLVREDYFSPSEQHPRKLTLAQEKLCSEITSSLSQLKTLLGENGRLSKMAMQQGRQYLSTDTLEIPISDSERDSVVNFLEAKGINIRAQQTPRLPQSETLDQPISSTTPTKKSIPFDSGKGLAHATPEAGMGTFHKITTENGIKKFTSECYFGQLPPDISTDRTGGLPAEIYFKQAKQLLDKFLELSPASPSEPITIRGPFKSDQVEAILIYAAYLNKYERKPNEQISIKNGTVYNLQEKPEKQVRLFHNEMLKQTKNKSKVFQTGLFNTSEKAAALGTATFEELERKTSNRPTR